MLKNKYESMKESKRGRPNVREENRADGETFDESICRLICEAFDDRRGVKREGVKREGVKQEGGGSLRKDINTFVIDEAHVLRNPETLWTLGAMLIGQHAHRSIMATGT